MKYLEIPSFAHLTAVLTARDCGDIILTGRVEAYSCKKAGTDKKLFKELSEEYEREVGSSPVQATSPFGPVNEAFSRRVLIEMTCVLNMCFPDYDFKFSLLKAEENWVRETNFFALQANIDSTLAAALPGYDNGFRQMLWESIASEMLPQECDLYQYFPDAECEIMQDCIWSFNYFFYNRRMRRILFFRCAASSKLAVSIGDVRKSIDMNVPMDDSDYDEDGDYGGLDDDVKSHQFEMEY
mmetsp:Transcript_30458/g.76471  ORF Transcript_30458/g.76471 Transcript_30458/m.76471 type:complete len:240 (-) Transcript_30458:27-746(-)|eukprot:CAMPEP_0177630998 /NCGR_PEP_ID=MMETSP0447-20121125/1515_1 /TAXON_ID=0 /ORGANISM="Stygamoeba regulata, Strain BSH-02190019" /LENGTH=239 /DNA_ID=CAMNT_0019132453 /DNA_START=293 /DNA_END=1012 /DNA_ORIENTATION=-